MSISIIRVEKVSPCIGCDCFCFSSQKLLSGLEVDEALKILREHRTDYSLSVCQRLSIIEQFERSLVEFEEEYGHHEIL